MYKRQRKYIASTMQMHGLVPDLQETAIAAFEAKPEDNPEVVKTLLGLIWYNLNAHNLGDRMRPDMHPPAYDRAMEIAQVLYDHKVDAPGAAALIGTAAMYAGNEKVAEEMLPKAKESNLSEAGKKAAQEVKLRVEEAKKDDLPRVKLETTEGDIVVELFEDQAPGAVGNFVSLVEKGFYDGLTFHRVIEGFMAQGGDPDGNGTGGPGYRIYCECDEEDARMHFAGTLSMAHSGPDTGGSQFFITYVPTPHLDGLHTAFGLSLIHI